MGDAAEIVLILVQNIIDFHVLLIGEQDIRSDIIKHADSFIFTGLFEDGEEFGCVAVVADRLGP